MDSVTDYTTPEPEVSLEAKLIACAQTMVATMIAPAADIDKYRQWLRDEYTSHKRVCPCAMTLPLSAVIEISMTKKQYMVSVVASSQRSDPTIN